MKKRFILLITGIIICLGMLLYFQVSNKNTLKENNVENKNNSLAIMIKENGASDYTRASSNNIPIGKYKLNEEKTNCENGGKISDYNSETGKIKMSLLGADKCYLYFDYVPNYLYSEIEQRYKNSDEFVKLYNPTEFGDATTYDNNIYYFTGAVEDNNVFFAGFCWKMVRTTDTGGIKMVYNGIQKDIVSTTPIEESAYTSVSNDATYPYTFDSTSKTWVSTNKTNSATGSISFSVATAGDYYISYTMSSEAGFDKAYFYKNGTALENHSGTETGTIALTGLTTSDVIKVSYTKDSSGASGNDTVTFSVGKASGEVVKSCNNSGTSSQLASTKEFNSTHNSPAYVGYMYNTVYTYSSKSMSSQSNIVFGNTFTYSNGTYTLSDTKTVETWSSGYNTINSNHYTCFTTGTTCTSLYYVYYTSSSTAYYITLTGGKSVDDAINEMLYADDVNTKDSTIKTYIDTWYKENMTSYTDKLEDTVFCNDRTMNNQSTNGWNPNGGSTTTYLYFKNYNTNYSLACTNETDRFSMSNSKAKLDYPVGLLSAPEVWLAYRNASYSTYYLKTGNWYWLASPYNFYSTNAYGWGVNATGGMSSSSVNNAGGVRPAISLKPGTGYTSGDGSYTNPFVVE